MKKDIRCILIGSIVFLSLIISANLIVGAETTFDEITLDPTNPSALSTFTINAKITSDEIIQEVKAVIEECKEGFCYTGEEIIFTETSDGEYEGTATLSHDDAIELKYYVKAKIDGSWIESSTTQIDLSTGGGNVNGNSKNTPGFELIFSLMAIIIGFVLFRRKR
jgi:hypothetical protein